MMNKMFFGIIINNDGKIINHRSIIKVFLNPFLRLVGLQIATNYDKKNNKLLYPVIMRCEKRKEIIFSYELCENCKVIRRRIIL